MNEPQLALIDIEKFKAFLVLNNFRDVLDNPSWNQVYLGDYSLVRAILAPNGHMIGAVGISKAWEGVGEVWLLTTKELNKYPQWMIRTFRKLANPALYNLHRLQVFTTCVKAYARFAELIGFEPEGLLRKHSVAGEDHIIFSRV